MRINVVILLLTVGLLQFSIASSTLKTNPYTNAMKKNNSYLPDYNWNFNLINSSLANKISNGSRNIVIAVLDSGFDYRYEFINKSLWINPSEKANNGLDDDHNGYVDDIHGWDFVNNDSQPLDDQTHGTFIASLILGLNDSHIFNQPLEGIAPNITLMPLKILDKFNYIDASSQFVDAVKYAVNNGASIISLSIQWQYPPQEVINILNWAYNQGVFIAGITGNYASDYPGLITGIGQVSAVMAAGSVSKTLQKSDFSQYGPGIEIVAPAEEVYGLTLINKGINLVNSSLRINDSLVNSMIPMEFSNTTISPISAKLIYAGFGESFDYYSINATNKIVLLDRGTISFADKVTYAEVNGAIGVIVANNVPGEFYGSLQSFEDLPAVGISQEDGNMIKELLNNGTTMAKINLSPSNITQWSGTSFAAPLVAGTAGLMYSVNPSINNSYVREILHRTATDLNETGYDIYTGYGLLNTSLAVETANDSTKPTINIHSEDLVNNKLNLSFDVHDNVGLYRITIQLQKRNSDVYLLNKSYQGIGINEFIFTKSDYSINYNTTIIITAEDLAGNTIVYSYTLIFPVPTSSSTTFSSPGFILVSVICSAVLFGIFKKLRKF